MLWHGDARWSVCDVSPDPSLAHSTSDNQPDHLKASINIAIFPCAGFPSLTKKGGFNHVTSKVGKPKLRQRPSTMKSWPAGRSGHTHGYRMVQPDTSWLNKNLTMRYLPECIYTHTHLPGIAAGWHHTCPEVDWHRSTKVNGASPGVDLHVLDFHGLSISVNKKHWEGVCVCVLFF